MRDVACHHHRAGQHHTGFHRVLGQFLANLGHRTIEVDLHHVIAEVVVGDFGEELRRVGFELFEEYAVAGDLAEGLTIGAA